MKYNDIAEQLTAVMKQGGYELDGCDRHIIRTTASKASAIQTPLRSQHDDKWMLFRAFFC